MQIKSLRAIYLALLLCICAGCVSASVSYDRKAIAINGRRRILFSGSIHYPRSTPEMWPDLIMKAKEGGLDVIQTYVFWNGHEPSPRNYYFEGNYDLVRFVKLVHEAGLYLHLRIGPYVCAEWNFGGFPVWLKYIPGISFRTNNPQFKAEMRKFTKKIVKMMKAEKLFESQGGPIILSQIENEYGPLEYVLGPAGKTYTKWTAKMALGLGTGVPWVMCKQDDAPDPIINTCNGFYCDYFSPNTNYKPKMWTEAWTGWYTQFGGPVPQRPAEDLAFSVAKFLQKGGAFVNYYMYHGGTNFGRTAGGPFIATSYDYDAPIDEYGLIRQPKWGHLRDLHRAVKLCEQPMVSSDADVVKLGDAQEAHVFKDSGSCCAFLANYDAHSFAKVAFGGSHHNLPPWSISILPDCKNTVYNTARFGAQSSRTKMTPVPMHERLSWEAYSEDPASENYNTFTSDRLLEQINTTRDTSDYLWYTTDVVISSDEKFPNSGEYPVLNVLSAGHALHVFVNGELSGTAYGSLESPKLSYSEEVRLRVGVNTIALLSVAVGLPNVGPHYETWNAGILGPVSLSGLNEGRRDLSWQKWTYKIGLKGEALGLQTTTDSSQVEWTEGAYVSEKRPLVWYKTTFDAPMGVSPLGLDMGGMGKGQIWVNGRNVGRYWPAYTAKGTCGGCGYEGTYHEKKCAHGCGEASQRWYHVPREWVNPEGNILVVLEELGGDPNTIALVRREVDTVCADVHEWQATLGNYKLLASGRGRKPMRPKVHLECGYMQKIQRIKFASFGTPKGACGEYAEGGCHAQRSYDVFNSVCVGQNYCAVSVTPENFGGDPCPGVMKTLAVEAVCS